LYRWQSYWFDRNLALQRRLHPTSTSRFAADPVFILGLWRSGTTFMHDLLGVSPALICPATWQCMNPSNFRLRAPPRLGKAVRRPMDAFTIDTFSPQEDEFAMLALGVPSVYRGFFDPRRLEELAHWLDPDAWTVEESGDWVTPWQEFLAGVADGKEGRLLLKSPNHTFRIRALMKEFPAAAYVWLVRDPEEVFLSNRKMWVSMFQQYAFWEWDSADLDRFLTRAFQYAAECLVCATTALPKERLVVVDFQRLTSAPVETIEALNRRLSLGAWDDMSTAVTQAAAGKSDYRQDTYTEALPSGVRVAIGELRTAQHAALGEYGS
jgi:omega-hydroxy-beta-dihydromenaquinone-9 sulfotransferase